MRLSIVIPAYNSEKTIRKCLEAIFSSDFKDFEVIVVDDASCDNTLREIAEFPCKVIQLPQNSGPAHARFTGAKEAASQAVVFIDADIIIGKETLSAIVKALALHQDAAAIVGILSTDKDGRNFFSDYKNLYMNYILNRCPERIDFIYGSFFAVRKPYCGFLTENRKHVEDTELGLRLEQKGLIIILDKKLEVAHLKKYTFFSLIRNDFLIPFYWAGIFVKQQGWKAVLQKKRFCHSHKEQLISVALAPLCLAAFFLMPYLAILFLCAQVLLNRDFFVFLYRRRKGLFLVKAILLNWLDTLVMAAGIISGFCSVYFNLIFGRFK